LLIIGILQYPNSQPFYHYRVALVVVVVLLPLTYA